jgi:hypothetical protein
MMPPEGEWQAPSAAAAHKPVVRRIAGFDMIELLIMGMPQVRFGCSGHTRYRQAPDNANLHRLYRLSRQAVQ